MTVAEGAEFALSAEEFDLLRDDLVPGAIPFPLEAPSIGATLAERSARAAEAYRALERRGLAVGGALAPRPAALLRLLAAPPASVHVLGHADGPIRALAATDGSTGVLGRIVGGEVRLAEIRPTALATSIVGALPPGEPGPGGAMAPFQRDVLVRATDEDELADDPFGGDLDDRSALVRAGMPDGDAARLVDLAANRCAGGQFGVARGTTPAAVLVTWFDTHQGRYLMVVEGSWVSIAPADDRRIAQRIADALSTVA